MLHLYLRGLYLFIYFLFIIVNEEDLLDELGVQRVNLKLC